MVSQQKVVFLIKLIVLLFINSTTFAQESPKTDRKITLGFNYGYGDANSMNLSDQLWEKYTPTFVIPTDSLYSQPSNMMNYGITSFMQGTVHFSYRNRLLDSKKIRSSIGIVFGSGSTNNANQNWNKSESFRLDTLTSSQTGEQFFIDSISNRSIGRRIESNEFVIGLSQHFQTDPTRRFSLHLSFIAQYGFSINTRAYTSDYTWSYSSSYNMINDFGYYQNEQLAIENVPLFHSFSILMPLEVSIQPWKNSKKLQGISIGLSARPTLKLLKIDDQRASLTGISYGLSFRYAI